MSWKKAQVCRQEAKYFGFVVLKGHWSSTSEEASHIFSSIPSVQQVQYLSQTPRKKFTSSLGLPDSDRSGYWVSLNLPSLCIKPQQGLVRTPLEWGPEQAEAFKEIKRLLTSAPALELPDVTRDFNLFVHGNNHMHWESSHR